MILRETPMIAAAVVQQRVAELGEMLNNDYAGRHVVMAIVLKGAMLFAADLMRHMRCPVELEFVRARSYTGTSNSGALEILLWPDRSLTDRHVLLVEDILDTGRTTHALLQRLQAERPASIKTCYFLNKRVERAHKITPDYTGFEIEDAFVVGYGLDYDQAYRHLPAVHVLDPD